MSHNMRRINSSHPAIAALRIVGDIGNPLDDNVDLIVQLADGRRFSFTAFTPANLTRLMRRRLSFVSPGLLVVASLAEESLIDAIEDAVEQGIEQFGVLQR